jgi:hypothetical protein
MRKEGRGYREKGDQAPAEQTEPADDTPIPECPYAGDKRCSTTKFSHASKIFSIKLVFRYEFPPSDLIFCIHALSKLMGEDYSLEMILGKLPRASVALGRPHKRRWADETQTSQAHEKGSEAQSEAY